MQGGRRSIIGRKRPVDLAARGAAAALALALAYAGVIDTLANVVTKVDPARAYALAPWNASITAAMAQLQFTLKPNGDENSAAGRFARDALRRDPTAADALTVLGFQSQVRNDTAQTRRIFTYSLALTRRELQPRLWAIEEAVGRGDIASAISSYELALRTSPAASELLFPVLSMAIAQPKIRAALVPPMQTDAPWTKEFIRYLSVSATDARPVVPFYQQLERAHVRIEDEDKARVVNALVAGGYPEPAWEYYATFRRGADRRRARDPQFTRSFETPAVFDWTPANDGILSATILPNDPQGMVEFYVPPSAGGALLEQTQLLRPGSYRLEGRSAGIDQPAASLPYWTLICTDGHELGRVIVPNSTAANGAFAGRFTVPSNCPIQRLSLRARPSDQIAGVSGQILFARLAPATADRTGANGP